MPQVQQHKLPCLKRRLPPLTPRRLSMQQDVGETRGRQAAARVSRKHPPRMAQAQVRPNREQRPPQMEPLVLNLLARRVPHLGLDGVQQPTTSAHHRELAPWEDGLGSCITKSTLTGNTHTAARTPMSGWTPRGTTWEVGPQSSIASWNGARRAKVPSTSRCSSPQSSSWTRVLEARVPMRYLVSFGPSWRHC